MHSCVLSLSHTQNSPENIRVPHFFSKAFVLLSWAFAIDLNGSRITALPISSLIVLMGHPHGLRDIIISSSVSAAGFLGVRPAL